MKLLELSPIELSLPRSSMSEEVTMTSTGVWSLSTGHWSDSAVITVSNAPNIDPRARVISIRKKRNDQKLEPGILDKQILDIGSLHVN